jgi:hypothetical protein
MNFSLHLFKAGIVNHPSRRKLQTNKYQPTD